MLCFKKKYISIFISFLLIFVILFNFTADVYASTVLSFNVLLKFLTLFMGSIGALQFVKSDKSAFTDVVYDYYESIKDKAYVKQQIFNAYKNSIINKAKINFDFIKDSFLDFCNTVNYNITVTPSVYDICNSPDSLTNYNYYRKRGYLRDDCEYIFSQKYNDLHAYRYKPIDFKLYNKTMESGYARYYLDTFNNTDIKIKYKDFYRYKSYKMSNEYRVDIVFSDLVTYDYDFKSDTDIPKQNAHFFAWVWSDVAQSYIFSTSKTLSDDTGSLFLHRLSADEIALCVDRNTMYYLSLSEFDDFIASRGHVKGFTSSGPIAFEDALIDLNDIEGLGNYTLDDAILHYMDNIDLSIDDVYDFSATYDDVYPLDFYPDLVINTTGVITAIDYLPTIDPIPPVLLGDYVTHAEFSAFKKSNSALLSELELATNNHTEDLQTITIDYNKKMKSISNDLLNLKLSNISYVDDLSAINTDIDVLEGVVSDLKDTVNSNAIDNTVDFDDSNIIDSINANSSGILSEVSEVVEGSFTNVSDKIDSATNTISDTFTDSLTDVKDYVNTKADSLTNAIDDFKTVVTGYYDKIFDFDNADTIDLSPLSNVSFKDKFPFCIPFDFFNLIKSFSLSPKKPVFLIDINTKYLKIKHEVDLNIIKYPVGFLRLSFLFFFVYVLISKTKDFIKW